MTESLAGSKIASPEAVTVFAPAKVNLVLRVLDRRADGFHNLWSLMQTVGLEDQVSVRINERGGIRLQCDDPSLSVDRTNLVYRAAETVLLRCRQKVGVDIVLTKRIPMGAGLGGGSSDAAATIMGLNRLLNLGWSAADMAQIGQTLGSDVPFFFFAPTAIVTGRGEEIRAVGLAGERWVVLVNPGFSVETRWAYQALSSSRRCVHPLDEALTAFGKVQQLSWELVLEKAQNDFEQPVFHAHPLLRTIKGTLLTLGAEAALLSGSGATVFGVFQDEQKARQAANDYPTGAGFKVYAAATGSSPLRCCP
ncbi:MAG: 4-(cytidine 5'-diphospho)-2-C-methyl-D-erythritol kinase [Nitrospira sp.]|nr:4-(cytidine 5'-diphospho)-2-C-methyl-D-erythritol kinase [Nitrospira sp.]